MGVVSVETPILSFSGVLETKLRVNVYIFLLDSFVKCHAKKCTCCKNINSGHGKLLLCLRSVKTFVDVGV